MTRIEAIEAEIKKLSAAEAAQLRDWLLERDAKAWDRQIEADAKSGKLDKLFAKSIQDHREGHSTEL